MRPWAFASPHPTIKRPRTFIPVASRVLHRVPDFSKGRGGGERAVFIVRAVRSGELLHRFIDYGIPVPTGSW